MVDMAGSSTMPPIVKDRGSRYTRGGGLGLLFLAPMDPPHHHPCSKVAWAHLTRQIPTDLCTCNPPSLAPRLPTPLLHIGAMHTSAHPLWRGLVAVLHVGRQQDLWCNHHGLLQQHPLLARHERRTGSRPPQAAAALDLPLLWHHGAPPAPPHQVVQSPCCRGHLNSSSECRVALPMRGVTQ